MDTGYVVVVQENLLGTALREPGGEGTMNPPTSCFLFSKLKGNIEKMSSRITFTVVSSLDIKILGEFRPSRSVSAFMCGDGNGSQSVASPGKYLPNGSQEFL